jgi:hypothetical protein
MPQDPAAADTAVDAQHVRAMHDQVRDELRRADSKATTLLSLVGIAAAGIVALATSKLTLVAAVALGTAALPFIVAVLVLLSTIRPRLGRNAGKDATPGTWLYAVHNGPAALLGGSERTPQTLAADVVLLGRLVVRKSHRGVLAVERRRRAARARPDPRPPRLSRPAGRKSRTRAAASRTPDPSPVGGGDI